MFHNIDIHSPKFNENDRGPAPCPEGGVLGFFRNMAKADGGRTREKNQLLEQIRIDRNRLTDSFNRMNPLYLIRINRNLVVSISQSVLELNKRQQSDTRPNTAVAQTTFNAPHVVIPMVVALVAKITSIVQLFAALTTASIFLGVLPILCDDNLIITEDVLAHPTLSLGQPHTRLGITLGGGASKLS